MEVGRPVIVPTVRFFMFTFTFHITSGGVSQQPGMCKKNNIALLAIYWGQTNAQPGESAILQFFTYVDVSSELLLEVITIGQLL